MALRLDYVLRETGQNIGRNVALTITAILTVAVSLTLAGGAFLFQQRSDNAFSRFQEGVEFIVWMNPTATQEQIDSVGRELEGSPQVDRITYVGVEETYAEAQQLWQDDPEFLESVTPESLPTSYRVVPANPDADVVVALGDGFVGKPGVREVTFAREQIQELQDGFRTASRVLLIVSFVLLAASAVLIVTTIRTAIFARRREIEVMKLVGATNGFIRVPFVLEGVIEGILGAVTAVGLILAFNELILERYFVESDSLELLRGFVLNSGELSWILGGVIAGGALLGAIGSFVASSLYLKV